MDRRSILALASLALVSLAPACDRAPHEPASSPHPAPAATPAAPNTPNTPPPVAHPLPFAPNVNTRNTLTWDDPRGWERQEPSSRMRIAQYRVPHVEGDTNDAELTVFTFGPGQGGDIDANLQRWYGQVALPDGGSSRDAATRATFTVNGMRVTETEVAGRLAAGMAMPGAPPPPSFEHGRLLAAIVETPNGPWFFKLTGPDATVASARASFETMLHSMQPRAPQ